MSMQLHELVSYLDTYLRIAEIPDYAGALNGLQVANAGQVSRLAVAVDASARSIQGTVERKCDLLLVHHGLFWDGNQPVTGRRYRRLKALLEGDLAVYSAHLPLDVHPQVGNNAVLARELGVAIEDGFGDYKGTAVGVRGRLDISREALTARLDDLLGGPVRLIPGGSERIATVAVVTGGAGSMLPEAAALGIDALVTGEGSHHTWFDAMEGGVNAYYGGHYATETWGVRALAGHIQEQFGLPWEFLDLPTGL
ncbi:MAG: Nif3-like dinuclear metal center hexameric protein [Gemmatimonadota bacterium]